MLFHIINKVGVKITRFLRNFFSSFQLTPENKAKQSGSSNSSELNKVRVLLEKLLLPYQFSMGLSVVIG